MTGDGDGDGDGDGGRWCPFCEQVRMRDDRSGLPGVPDGVEVEVEVEWWCPGCRGVVDVDGGEWEPGAIGRRIRLRLR